MNRIESVNNEKVKYYKKIRERKYINEFNEYIVEGEHLVEEAIKCGLVKEIISLDEIDYNLPVTLVNEKVMSSISLLKSIPNIMAVVKKRDNKEIKGKKVILLDDVQDPGNVGTIIRNCVAFNIDTLVLSEGCASIYNDKVIRASQGLCFHLNIVQMDIEKAINLLKDQDITIYGTGFENSVDLDNINNIDSFGVIFGSEGQGIKPNILSMCDKIIKIEMNENCESLNVGVSSGIIMHKFR